MTSNNKTWQENLLALLSYSDATHAVTNEWLQTLRRAGEPCPRKADFNLSALEAHQDSIYMSEHRSESELIILFNGKTLVDAMGIPLKGINVFEKVSENNREVQKKYYHLLETTPCAGVVTRWGTNAKGQPLFFDITQLPLLDENGAIRFYVGAGHIRAAHSMQGNELRSSTIQIEHQESIFYDIGYGVP